MRVILACIVVCAACGQNEKPTPRSEPANLSPELMKRMLTAGQPCIESFRDKQMPEPYETTAILRKDKAGNLAMDFTRGDRSEFNLCITEAIRVAAIPAEGITGPTEIPLAFSFKQ